MLSNWIVRQGPKRTFSRFGGCFGYFFLSGSFDIHVYTKILFRRDVNPKEPTKQIFYIKPP